MPWSGCHCPVEVVALWRWWPCLEPATPVALQELAAKHSAPGRGGRAEGQGVAFKCLKGVKLWHTLLPSAWRRQSFKKSILPLLRHFLLPACCQV